MTSPTGYNSYTDGDTQVVAITNCDPKVLQATGTGRGGMSVTIDVGTMPAGLLYFPMPGEQWNIKRVGNVWRLDSKVPVLDPKLNNNVAQAPGSLHIGVTNTHFYGDVYFQKPPFMPAQVTLANIVSPTAPSILVPNTAAQITIPFNNILGQNGDFVTLNQTSGDPLGGFRLLNRGWYRVELFCGMVVPGSNGTFGIMMWGASPILPYNPAYNYSLTYDYSPYLTTTAGGTLRNVPVTYYAQAGELLFMTAWQNTNAAQNLFMSPIPPRVSITYLGDLTLENV